MMRSPAGVFSSSSSARANAHWPAGTSKVSEMALPSGASRQLALDGQRLRLRADGGQRARPPDRPASMAGASSSPRFLALVAASTPAV